MVDRLQSEKVEKVQRSGLLTTVTALLALRRLSAKAVAHRLTTQHANVFLHLQGTGDQIVRNWESTLVALGGKMVLDPIPGTPAEGSGVIQVPLTPVNEAKVRRQKEYLKKNAPLRFPEVGEWVTFGLEIEIADELASVTRLGRAISLVAERRQFEEEHLMILSGVWRRQAKRISLGQDRPIITFHHQCLDLCGYSIRIICEGLQIRIARPSLPSSEAVEQFKQVHLKRERIYQAKPAKPVKRAKRKVSTGNRAKMDTKELCAELRISTDWAGVAKMAGVTRQAIFAFAARHDILSPRKRMQVAIRTQAAKRVDKMTVDPL